MMPLSAYILCAPCRPILQEAIFAVGILLLDAQLHQYPSGTADALGL
jgi:hypothetical protein